MGYLYTSLEPSLDGVAQVVYSDEPLDHLEGLARWVRTEGEAPEAEVAPKTGDDGTGESTGDDGSDDSAVEGGQVPTEPPAAPEKPHAGANKPEWVAYAESKGLNVDGLTVAEIKDLVGDA